MSPPSRRVGVDLSVAVPLLLVHVVGLGLAPFTFSWPGLAAFAAMYLVTGLGVTAGAHRLFTHRTFAPTPIVREALALAFLLAAQGSLARWVRDHRVHHRHSDAEGDPHSPRDGLWHAHLGWLWRKPPTREEARALYARWTSGLDAGWVGRVFGGGPALVGLHVGAALTAYVVGACIEAGIGPDTLVAGWRTGVSVLVWGVALRIVAVMHGTFLVNSMAHRWGARHPEGGDARNNAFVAAVALGEGWHANHHARPGAANNGFFRWWQLDVTFVVLVALGALGLVHDLRVWRGGRMERWFGYARARPSWPRPSSPPTSTPTSAPSPRASRATAPGTR